MCEPLTIAAVGVSLAGAAANASSQSANAAAQNRHNAAMSLRNQETARQTARNQYDALGARIEQERVRTGEESKKISREAMEARSRVVASAAEAGVAGGSLDALLEDFERQEGEYQALLDLNLEFTEDQAERDKEAARIGLEGRLLSSTPNRIQGPNMLGAALGAFSTALSTGTNVYSNVKK